MTTSVTLIETGSPNKVLYAQVADPFLSKTSLKHDPAAKYSY